MTNDDSDRKSFNPSTDDDVDIPSWRGRRSLTGEEEELPQTTPLAPRSEAPDDGGAPTAAYSASDPADTPAAADRTEIIGAADSQAPTSDYGSGRTETTSLEKDAFHRRYQEAPEFEAPVGVAAPAHVTGHEEELEAARKAARRGTQDLGQLILRVAVGGLAILHGLQKLFNLWGGPDLDQFEQFLNSGGWDTDKTHWLSIVAAVSELGGGVLLVIGLVTPIAGSAIIGTMLCAAATKLVAGGAGLQFFAASGGVEYELLLAVGAAVVILIGPGKLALDFPFAWSRRPFIGSALWVLIGIGAAVAVWWIFNGTNVFDL